MILFPADSWRRIRALFKSNTGKECVMSGKALRLIQPVSKRDQVVDSFKEALLSGIIQPREAIVERKAAPPSRPALPLTRAPPIHLAPHRHAHTLPPHPPPA